MPSPLRGEGCVALATKELRLSWVRVKASADGRRDYFFAAAFLGAAFLAAGFVSALASFAGAAAFLAAAFFVGAASVRQSVVAATSVSVRVDIGARRLLKQHSPIPIPN